MSQQLIFTEQPIVELQNIIGRLLPSAVLILTDENTFHYGEAISKKLEGIIFSIEPGEKQKNLQTIDRLWQQWLDLGIDRHALLINVGGGVVTDLGGFAASCYKRGIRYINVPTSLLGQVDAAFGSKTGCNLGGVKNSIGTFWPAEAVLFSTAYLNSLPIRELESGKAEILKHGLIADSLLWYDASALRPGECPTADLIQRAVQVKLEITTRDPFEKGERQLLNFGHSFGHAIESASHQSEFPLLHGEAIILGLCAEIELSATAGMLNAELAVVLQSKLKSLFKGIPVSIAFEELLPFMVNDKKNFHGHRMVLLKEVGEAEWNKLVEVETLQQVWNKFLEWWNS